MGQDAYGHGSFTIPADGTRRAYQAVMRDADVDLFQEVLDTADLYTAAMRVGFDVDDQGAAGLLICAYGGKSSDEEYFLATLAPYAEEGSYMDWNDGNDSIWRTIVRHGRLVTQVGRIVFEDCTTH